MGSAGSSVRLHSLFLSYFFLLRPRWLSPLCIPFLYPLIFSPHIALGGTLIRAHVMIDVGNGQYQPLHDAPQGHQGYAPNYGSTN